jgi:integrase
MPIGAFNKSHARDFKQKFISLPSNMNKKREYREKSKRASEERKTFSTDDLKKLFESVEYQKGFREPFQYWVPIIGLYTGARLEEICRLRVESFNVVDGINVIQIIPDDDWRGKT